MYATISRGQSYFTIFYMIAQTSRYRDRTCMDEKKYVECTEIIIQYFILTYGFCKIKRIPISISFFTDSLFQAWTRVSFFHRTKWRYFHSQKTLVIFTIFFSSASVFSQVHLKNDCITSSWKFSSSIWSINNYSPYICFKAIRLTTTLSHGGCILAFICAS